MVRFACVYVRGLFGLMLLTVAATLLFHCAVAIGIHPLFANCRRALFYGAVGVSVSVGTLAAQRNIMEELKSCPMWLRTIAIALFIYGIAASGVSSGGQFDVETGSGACLFLESLPLCIAYSVVRGAPPDPVELVKRVRSSIFALALFLVFVAAVFGVFADRHAHG